MLLKAQPSTFLFKRIFPLCAKIVVDHQQFVTPGSGGSRTACTVYQCARGFCSSLAHGRVMCGRRSPTRPTHSVPQAMLRTAADKIPAYLPCLYTGNQWNRCKLCMHAM